MTRNRTIYCTILMSALVTGAAITDRAAALPHAYRVTDLGTLRSGTADSWGYGINDSGQVAGTTIALYDTVNRPFLWTPTTPNGSSGTMVDLGSLVGPGGGAYGQGINASGQVTGWSSVIVDYAHAYLWTPTTPNGSTGTMVDLGTLGGRNSYGFSVNDGGQVTGRSYTTGNVEDHAFRWTPTSPNGPSGVMHDLGTLGGTYSGGQGINAGGQVTGYSGTTGDTAQHAFLYDGTMHDLGTLGGTNSIGYGINASGQVTGHSATTGNAAGRAFLYDGTMHDLGTLGGTQSIGFGINASGQVTGMGYTTGDAAEHAFLYTSGSGIVDLNALIDPLSGWVLRTGYAINDAGQITGWGQIDGYYRAFLLTPVPEPASLALLALGIPFLVGRNSRRLRTGRTRGAHGPTTVLLKM